MNEPWGMFCSQFFKFLGHPRAAVCCFFCDCGSHLVIFALDINIRSDSSVTDSSRVSFGAQHTGHSTQRDDLEYVV